MFTITNNNLKDAIQAAHDRRVNVRIISDDECLKMRGSDVYDMKAYGITARADSNRHAHMHNKFAIIDDEFLVSGSFNWTQQAVKSNQENVLVTDDSFLVSGYKEEFERLWIQFEGNIVPSYAPSPSPTPAKD